MPPAIPLATYRLQFHAGFTFDDATAILPYLKSLGITHVYASPFMKARKGSMHGYDIVDHNVINSELGGEDGFERFSHALKGNDLGLILDFVPNHMGVHFADNVWWLDVLEWSEASPHAASFDIDWDMLPYRAKGGVLLPILGTSYGTALDNGDITLRYDASEGSFSAWYFEHRLPIAPQRYSEILRVVVNDAGAGHEPVGQQILGIAARFTGPRHPNRNEAPTLKAALAAIPGASHIITRGLEAYRAGQERPAQTQGLHRLLERQHYRLGHWRLATSEINYRRFFDVNSLAGLRVEDAMTFAGIHRLVKRLIAEQKLQGVRLDHIDGLRDPAQYCQRLQRLIRDARGLARQPFYLVVEKILAEGEEPPKLAGVHGTTGYEWLNVISRVLLDGKGLDALDETWRQASNIPPHFMPVVIAAKRRVLETLLASEFTVLSRLLARIASGHYATRDFSADSLRRAFELYVLHFPLYRTYITSNGPSARDRDLIEQTIEQARSEWFEADEGLFDFLRDVLTLDLAGTSRPAPGRPRIRRFAFKVQQFTGPMMAKSLEDTAFYRYHRLLALNEVGGDPSASTLPIETFHDMMKARVRQSPGGMTSTTTHDTKRAEDARTRILALSELAGEWTSLVGRWKALNAPHITTRRGIRAPSAALEYMLYQALIGAWQETIDESFVARMKAYALKAVREAKLETSWLNPYEHYEQGVTSFIDRILDPTLSADFLGSLAPFARRTALLGALNSLSQITLKAMMPGVPDFYQGTEFWDLSLVDPDNRRPVDFTAREAALATLRNPDWKALAHAWPDGRLKLAWTKALLGLRHALPRVFAHGDYLPLQTHGLHREHVIAFARVHKRDAVIVAVTRWLAPLTDQGRTWPAGVLHGALNVKDFAIESVAIDGHQCAFDEMFRELPVAAIRARRK